MKSNKNIIFCFGLILIAEPTDAMERPAPPRTRETARVLFFEPQESASTIISHKRKIAESDSGSDSDSYHISRKQILIDYLKEKQLPEVPTKSLISTLSRPLRSQIPQETYFEDSFWISHPGRDLRVLAKDLMKELKQKPAYAKIIHDPQFIEQLTAYLSDRYRPIVIEQLRAVIPFGSLPAAPAWIANEVASKRTERRRIVREAFEENEKKHQNGPLIEQIRRLPQEIPLTFEEQWCKELSILAKWLNAAAQAKDLFYEDGILLLLNSLPQNHSLITQQNYCLKSLLSQVTGKNEHKRIWDALRKKGIK